MEIGTYASLRPKTYASQIVDLDAIIAAIKSLGFGKSYYFSISLENGTSKVFYVELAKAITDDTKYVYNLYRDYESYNSNGMYQQEDVLLKSFVSEGFPVDEIANVGATEIVSGSILTAMGNYVEVFVDAVQVMHLI